MGEVGACQLRKIIVKCNQVLNAFMLHAIRMMLNAIWITSIGVEVMFRLLKLSNLNTK